MSVSQSWKSLFTDWPKDVRRQGVVLSVLNEITPFKNFWLKDETILLERKNPDTSGSRFLVVNFDRIDSVRFVDPLSEETIGAMGFSA